MNDDACENLRLDNQLCFALYSTSLAMSKLYKPLLAELGLTYPQYLLMMVLWEKDGITSTLLGKKLVQDLGALSPVIKRLAAQGLIERRRNPKDDREVLIYLTKQGKSLRQKALPLPENLICASGLSLPEVVALRKQLESLRTHLHQYSSQQPQK
ncbi:MarR family transcriptional regulator [Aliiglaciecola sp. CAU 1673]|uniref:MarR family winged helix-turn-helix transcriptional regulator n=1 Tax=Aliiglaciecola sp. CAU 1673 TaxID=3032595 RepID=UPI0023D9BFD4|nr:MarR family transcriptional regulator [Aliiglaciecola sp. CAU 1673]MDF2178360.1 MarR family transcriptional regulator [Aliiglaciecola sp. CAU 1673]